jgi:glucose-1-phosphate cytidylyltransferase
VEVKSNFKVVKLMKAVILAGGLGTRLREETEHKPKPMVEIGERPIIWHIMKMLSQQGLENFVIALGYKGDQITDFFLNYETRTKDFKINLGESKKLDIYPSESTEKWNITLARTGLLTPTGGRIFRLREYLKNEKFLCTYGDGLADINLDALVDFHNSHGKIATVTAVKPLSRFGILQIEPSHVVSKFQEKPKVDQWINGGYFIFGPEIFEYLTAESILEEGPLDKLAADNQLMAYKHEGFWQPMDTFRELELLNRLWGEGNPPWRNW